MNNPEFIFSRGHHSFASSPDGLRSSSKIADGLFAEINLSANSIRDTIRRLLDTFEIPCHELKIYLRQDRNAGSDD